MKKTSLLYSLLFKVAEKLSTFALGTILMIWLFYISKDYFDDPSLDIIISYRKNRTEQVRKIVRDITLWTDPYFLKYLLGLSAALMPINFSFSIISVFCLQHSYSAFLKNLVGELRPYAMNPEVK
jgi:hypothetical protein